jgi:hypothetical protein
MKALHSSHALHKKREPFEPIIPVTSTVEVKMDSAGSGLTPAGMVVVLVIGAVALLLAIASLACFVMVLVKMFKNQQAGLGVACILLTFCVGVGPLIAFFVGWAKAGQWGIKGVMGAWTFIIATSMVFVLCMGVATTMLGQKASATFESVGHTIGR